MLELFSRIPQTRWRFQFMVFQPGQDERNGNSATYMLLSICLEGSGVKICFFDAKEANQTIIEKEQNLKAERLNCLKKARCAAGFHSQIHVIL